MLVFMRLVILLSKMFSFHPRGPLAPLRVHPQPTHPTDVFVSCGWNLYRALEGTMVKKINKLRSKQQKFKKWNLRENFSAPRCVNCDVEGIASFFLVSCAFAGKKLSSRLPSDAGESPTLSQLTLWTSKNSWFAWLKCFWLICLRGISTSLRLLSMMMVSLAAFH